MGTSELLDAVTLAKAEDPLARVTVVVPSHYAGLFLARELALAASRSLLPGSPGSSSPATWALGGASEADGNGGGGNLSRNPADRRQIARCGFANVAFLTIEDIAAELAMPLVARPLPDGSRRRRASHLERSLAVLQAARGLGGRLAGVSRHQRSAALLLAAIDELARCPAELLNGLSHDAETSDEPASDYPRSGARHSLSASSVIALYQEYRRILERAGLVDQHEILRLALEVTGASEEPGSAVTSPATTRGALSARASVLCAHDLLGTVVPFEVEPLSPPERLLLSRLMGAEVAGEVRQGPPGGEVSHRGETDAQLASRPSASADRDSISELRPGEDESNPDDESGLPLRVLECADPDEEGRAAARIVTLAAMRGTPLWRQAVLHPGGDRYARILERHLTTSGIPICGPRSGSLARSATARALTSFIDLAKGDLARADLIGLLLTLPIVEKRGERGLVPALSWDSLSAGAGVVGGLAHWRERIGRLIENATEGGHPADHCPADHCPADHHTGESELPADEQVPNEPAGGPGLGEADQVPPWAASSGHLAQEARDARSEARGDARTEARERERSMCRRLLAFVEELAEMLAFARPDGNQAPEPGRTTHAGANDQSVGQWPSRSWREWSEWCLALLDRYMPEDALEWSLESWRELHAEDPWSSALARNLIDAELESARAVRELLEDIGSLSTRPELVANAEDPRRLALHHLPGSFDTKPDLHEFQRLLITTLEGTGLGSLPFGEGVFVASFDAARGMDFDTVVLVGFADAQVPGDPPEDPILPDSLCSALAPGALRTRAERQEDRRTTLRWILQRRRQDRGSQAPSTQPAKPASVARQANPAQAQPAQANPVEAGSAGAGPVEAGGCNGAGMPPDAWVAETWVTWPRCDPRTGRANSPSRWIATNLRGADALVCPSFAWSMFGLPWLPANAPEASTPGNTTDPAATIFDVSGAALPTERELWELLNLAQEGRATPEVVRARWPDLCRSLEVVLARRQQGLTRFDGLAGSGRIDPSLGGKAMSATRFETYASCPRRFFFERVLDARPRQLPEDLWQIHPMEKGTMVHAILEDYEQERIEGASPSLERLLEIAEAHFASTWSTGRAGIPFMWKLDCSAIRRDMKRFFEEDRLEPIAVELTFGRGSDRPPVEIALPHKGDNERVVSFHGVIDRVDRAGQGEIVVTDYKTGRQDDLKNLERDPVDRGRRLQLPLYAMAARREFGATNARARYWLVSSSRSAPCYVMELDDEVERRWLEIVGLVAEGISTGVFPGVPGEPVGWRHGGTGTTFENCQHCDFDRICPAERYEEWETKKGDPRGEPLRKLLEDPPASLAGKVSTGSREG